MKKYITSTPDIMGGMPVVRGTRVPIARLLFLLKEGYTVEAIHDEFPHVPLKDIEGVLDELITYYNNSQNASKVL